VDISGLYWQRHALNASKCPPGLLCLDNGRLSLRTSDERVFDVAATTVSARLSGWGSMVLTVDSQSYVMQTSVGQLSAPFSKSQQRAIDAAERAGTLRTLPEWADLLRSAGASVRAAPINYRRWLLGGILVVVVAGAIVAIVLNGGL
jgi:hypothetical protein